VTRRPFQLFQESLPIDCPKHLGHARPGDLRTRRLLNALDELARLLGHERAFLCPHGTVHSTWLDEGFEARYDHFRCKLVGF